VATTHLQKSNKSILNTKVCDLSVEAERNALYNWVLENHKDLNVLVNNAGIQNWMTVSDDDFEKATAEITTNIVAPIHLTSLFIKLKSLNTIIMSLWTGLCTVKGACLLCNKGVFPFIYNFNETLAAKKEKIEVIEMIPQH
jgi:uncharacterized oxidoreductase